MNGQAQHLGFCEALPPRLSSFMFCSFIVIGHCGGLHPVILPLTGKVIIYLHRPAVKPPCRRAKLLIIIRISAEKLLIYQRRQPNHRLRVAGWTAAAAVTIILPSCTAGAEYWH